MGEVCLLLFLVCLSHWRANLKVAGGCTQMLCSSMVTTAQMQQLRALRAVWCSGRSPCCRAAWLSDPQK